MVLVAVACAWCERVRTESGWQTTQETDLNAPGVTHGICPECLERVVASQCSPASPQPSV